MTMLFAPGPINCHLNNFSNIRIDPPYFASSEFSDLVLDIQPLLQSVFKTRNQVLIGTGSGSLAMENCVTNFFSKGDAVIVINNGKYGDNFKKICVAFGLQVFELLAPDGEVVDSVLIENVLRFSGFDIKGFFVTHVETTTGVLNPIDKYLEIIRRESPTTLTIIDAVSSLLSEYISCDEYDVVISASQKGLQLPAGLFFMSISNTAYQHCLKSQLPKYYFDVEKEGDYQTEGQTRFTPASYLFPILFKQLRRIKNVGVDNIIQRTQKISHITKNILFSSPNFTRFTEHQSSSITIAKSQNAKQILNYLKSKNIVVGSGLRLLKDEVIRMRNFGFRTHEEDFEYVATTMAEWKE